MRKANTTGNLKVNAIAGTYVVTLGFNLPESECDGLLGFSILRKDHETGETKYLEGMKAFEETDPGFPPGSLYPTNKHPIQIFQWADYSAFPGKDYTYTVAALKGTPKKLTQYASTSVKIKTESPETGDHDVYFNRGTAASQEYVRRFGDLSPDKVADNKAFEWLSRGLYEALSDFVSSCEPGKHELRVAAYEFHYMPFLKVLKAASQKGVGIKVVYDAREASPGDKNREAVAAVKFKKGICKPREASASYISHNKFIVKLEEGEPVSIWSGGTNFSEGGIFGHSNVAHVVENAKVAQKYLKYWEYLHQDLENEELRPILEELTPVPSNPPAKGTSVIFSPRPGIEALEYYAELANAAKEGLLMTFAFGMHDLFKDTYKNSKANFRLALMEKKTRPFKKTEEAKKVAEEKAIQKLRNLPENVFAIGNFIRTNEFDGWLQERLTGLNKNVNYVHNKFMLIDPLGEDPIVVAGSANFSKASTTDNDENMLIIRGNKRVADIYLGEFMRLFTHFSFRESLQWRDVNDPPKPLRTDAWWKESFGDKPNSYKRKFFAQVNE